MPAGRLPGVLERCGFAYMKKHESQFDPALELLWEQGIRLHSFLRSGKVGEGSVRLSDEQEARFDAALRHHWGSAGVAL